MSTAMMPLLECGAVRPGKDVLALRYKNHEFRADLLKTGEIAFGTDFFSTPSAFSVHVKRLLTPGRKADDGWRSITYHGRLLSELRPTAPQRRAKRKKKNRAGGGKAARPADSKAPRAKRQRRLERRSRQVKQDDDEDDEEVEGAEYSEAESSGGDDAEMASATTLPASDDDGGDNRGKASSRARRRRRQQRRQKPRLTWAQEEVFQAMQGSLAAMEK